MKKAAGKTIRYSLILIVLLVGLLFAAPFFIDANQYKSLIVDQAEKATGRDIEIGELHASLFPWVGVRIDGVHIANPKGFAEGDMLVVKSLDVQVALLPLLGGQYQIERFILDSPSLNLARSADGFSNWEDLLPAATDAASGPQAKAAPSSAPAASPKPASEESEAVAGNGSILAALTAQSLQMNNGEVRFTDLAKGQDIRLSALNVEVDDVQMERPVALRLSGQLDGNAFALDAQVGPVGDLATLDAASLPLKGHFNVPAASLAALRKLVPELIVLGDGTLALDVQLEQRPNGVRVMAGSLNLNALHQVLVDLKAQMPDAGRMQIEQLSATLDGVRLADVNGTVEGIGGRLRYQARLNTPELSRRQLSQWLPELETMYAAHPDPWKTLKIGLLAAGDLQHVDIRDLQLLLNGELVQASGNVDFAKAPDIRLRIASRLLHADPWLPQPAKEADAGAPRASRGASTPLAMDPEAGSSVLMPVAHAAASQQGARIGAAQPAAGAAATSGGQSGEVKAVEPDLRFLKPWKISTVMQVDRLLLRGLDIGRLRADVNGSNGIISMNPIRFNLAGGSVEEKASLNAGVYPATWNEAVKIRDVQLQPVLKALAGNDLLSGKLQLDTHLAGRGLLPDAAVSRLSGKGNVLLRDGSLKGVDIPGTLRNIRTLGQGGGEQQKTDFSQLSGSFNLTNGVAKNDDLFMASPLFRLTGYGVVNLVARQMDYHLKPRLVGSLVGQGDTDTARKGLEVPLRLTGPLDAPKVALEVNLKTLLGNKEAVKNIIKNRKSIIKGLLGGGGLSGVIGGSQQAAPAKPQAPTQGQPARIKPAPQSVPAPQQQLNQFLNQVLPGL